MKKKILLIAMLFISMFAINNKVSASAVCDRYDSTYDTVCEYNLVSEVKTTVSETIYLYYNNTDTLIKYTEKHGMNKDKTMSLPNQNGVSTSGLPNEEKLRICTDVGSCSANFISASDISSGCPSTIYLYDSSFRDARFGKTDKYYSYFYFYNKQVSDVPILDISQRETKSSNGWVSYSKVDECTKNPEQPISDDPCDLISENLMGYINEGLKYIRIFVPILLLVLVAVDFLKAAFSSSEDAMKKTQAKTIKRIVIAVIIFFVPTIVNLILNLTNDIWSNINQCDINIK